MEAPRNPRVITIISARAEGATTLSLGLAAVLGARGRTALVDLNLESGDLATFLDLDESKTVYHLAYNAQLAPVGDEDLRQHLQWHDGFAVLTGITHPQHRKQVQSHFLGGLIDVLGAQFESVLIDGGRLQGSMPPELTAGSVVWVLVPRPLGMAAFDRTYRALEDVNAPWLHKAQVVLNRVSSQTLAEVASFIRAEYGLTVLGEVADCPEFWSQAELAHSLRALSGPIFDRRRFVRAYGEGARRMRTDLELLAERLTAAAPALVAKG